MGKLVIVKIKDNTIAVSKDFKDMGKGEIAHFLAELEVIKKQLVEMWDSF